MMKTDFIKIKKQQQQQKTKKRTFFILKMQDTDHYVGKKLTKNKQTIENYISKDYFLRFKKRQLQKLEFKLILKFYLNWIF